MDYVILISLLTILNWGTCFCTGYSETNNYKLPQKHLTAKKQEQPLILTDTIGYRQKLTVLANGDTSGRWPVPQPCPLKGAILPFKRIVAYYGNLYSKQMGALGQYPPQQMWQLLSKEVQAWKEADSTTEVQPALHYIALVAQNDTTIFKDCCFRMPESQIDSVLSIAKMGNAIVFLDLQPGRSRLTSEVPRLEKYLKMPGVHLALDPEFSMKDGCLPGQRIGSLDASDVNYCSAYLARLVKAYNLPPKILIVHRFTQNMLQNYHDIVLRPEVQIVINMDGWGPPTLKFSSYHHYIYREPIQFTGIKLFYKNDLKKPPYRMLTPQEILQLKPQPVYIQYQ
ncbi:hypothetical protein OU798_20985 [Prolixibacteraceae bacterium Z1-6]|uniref:Lipoprotein n=1 Tax=Draconibacterium aestuarii TaxID=2998507 RepID=A0A9X3J8R2_9BACT|nr:hypothetical protein [Prolixibacteraceae bacterium Z1-6]